MPTLDEIKKQIEVSLEKYQADHLILLVGGNPLPNAVVGPLLTKPGGKITLIHSKDTAVVAGRIVEAWNGRFTTVADDAVKVIEASRTSIEGVVYQVIKDEREENILGLNHTGGTKAMSTHAFRALEQFVSEKPRKAIFSYLDARDLALEIDVYERNTQGTWKLPDHSSIVKIGQIPFSLTKMLHLHRWETLEIRKPLTAPLFKDTTQALAEMTAAGRDGEWRGWKREYLHKAKLGKDDLGSDLWSPHARISLPPHSNCATVVTALKNALGLRTDTLDLGNDIPNSIPGINSERKRQVFCEWLDAKWLESYAFMAFSACKDIFNLKSVCISLEPYAIDSTFGTHFELDCVAVRGYQLYAVSCTVDSRIDGKPKLKLMEALMRARQIGGDEARVALLCIADDPERLEAEIRRDLDAGSKIKVFGKPDLLQLPTHFKEWIEKSSNSA